MSNNSGSSHADLGASIRVLAVAAFLVALACSSHRGAPSPAPAHAVNNDSSFAAFMRAQGFASWTVARPLPGNPAPRYPAQPRQDGSAGLVLAEFVVDTSGRADMATFRVRESTNQLFAESVRATVPAMRFVAAEVEGRKVKQLVQIPFEFEIAGGQGAPTSALDAVHRTVPCQQNVQCPVHRLQAVVVTAAR